MQDKASLFLLASDAALVAATAALLIFIIVNGVLNFQLQPRAEFKLSGCEGEVKPAFFSYYDHVKLLFYRTKKECDLGGEE